MNALTWALKVGASIFLIASFAIAQKVISPWEIPCSEETVKANLELTIKARVEGQLKDASGAPLVDSDVLLRAAGAKGKFLPYRTATTNKDGRFELGVVDAGNYRFLPAPNRGFKQPKEVKCYEGRDCELDLVLQLNPTDQPFAGCPIQ